MNTMAEDCFLVEGVDEREVEGFGKEKKTTMDLALLVCVCTPFRGMCFLVCDKEVMVRIIMSLSLFKSKKLLPTWKTLTGWRVETHTKTFLRFWS